MLSWCGLLPQVDTSWVWWPWFSFETIIQLLDASHLFHVLVDLKMKRTCNLFQILISMQPSHYINTLLVPRDGEIPVDVQCLADQGIFEVVCMLLTRLLSSLPWMGVAALKSEVGCFVLSISIFTWLMPWWPVGHKYLCLSYELQSSDESDFFADCCRLRTWSKSGCGIWPKVVNTGPCWFDRQTHDYKCYGGLIAVQKLYSGASIVILMQLLFMVSLFSRYKSNSKLILWHTTSPYHLLVHVSWDSPLLLLSDSKNLTLWFQEYFIRPL